MKIASSLAGAGAGAGAGAARKLKSSKANPPAASASTTPAIDSQIAKIINLASTLPPSAPSNSDLNPLADLVTLFSSLPTSFKATATPAQLEANRQAVHTALHALKSVFESLIAHGRIHGVLSNKAKKAKLSVVQSPAELASIEAVKSWLKQRWAEYLTKAAAIVGAHWDAGVRISALNALLSLLRTESQFLTSLDSSRQAKFASSTLAIVVKGLLVPTGGDGTLRSDVLDEFKKTLDRYDDIRFYFLQEAATLVRVYKPINAATSPKPPPTPPFLAVNLLSTLETITTMPTTSSEINEWWCSTPVALKATTSSNGSSKKRKLSSLSTKVDDGSTGVFDSSSDEEEEEQTTLSSKDSRKLLPDLLRLSAHKKVFQECWLSLLRLPLEEGEAKRILVILHRQVLPHMTSPTMLMDWLVDSIDSGGTIGILALNGLFTLMQKHNLEYSDFFTKLYSLLDREALHVRYRPRFFRLLQIFMGSSHLPSALVASFIKRLARLSLSAPPSGIVTIIPFIYNLLKLHPSCMPMIHRPEVQGSEFDAENDPFNPMEQDPIKTNAILSSLWELATLRSHYLASVSGLAKIFGEVMSKQSYAMEDFLDHSYGTMFETEVTRKIRNAPALAPVPERQPIGDSFFPAPKVTELSLDVSEGEVLDPVDLVSTLWNF